MSLSKFIEFVNNQNAEEVIDHDSWASCAVGRYAASLGVSEEIMNSREVLEGHEPGPHATTIRHRPALWGNSEIAELMVELGNQVVYLHDETPTLLAIITAPDGFFENSEDELHTYGDMEALLSNVLADT